MDDDWLKVFSGPTSLRELIIEYETIERKRDEMMQIIQSNKKWKLHMQNGGHLSAENTKLRQWTWTGTSNVGGQRWSHHGDGDTINYVVVEDRWLFVPEGAQKSWWTLTDLLIPNNCRTSRGVSQTEDGHIWHRMGSALCR